MRRLTVSLVVPILASALLGSGFAFAQEDVTAPALLEFSMSPVVFDTGPGPVAVDWCVTARDDFSGVSIVALSGPLPVSPGGVGFAGWPLEATACVVGTVPQFTPYAIWEFYVRVTDHAGNSRTYFPDVTVVRLSDGTQTEEPVGLCSLGPCEVINRPVLPLPDSDNDGAPDYADNCPDDPNADQADDDLDLIGNVCDSFPNDRDNEKAQCFDDLAACEAVPAFVDSDGDGEDDSTDACPGTPGGWRGRPVDGNGCSQLQFCWAIDMSTKIGARICRQSDWRNDEPLSKNPHDCVGLLKQGDRQPSACTALPGPRPIPSPPIL